MSTDDRSDATTSLIAHCEGDRKAVEELLPLLYGKLRALAGSMMREERAGHTLEPTGLVHEAYLRLVDVDRIDWNGKTHFYAMAARQMRRVLIDHARKHGAAKRGARPHRVTLNEAVAPRGGRQIDTFALHEALEKLARHNERRCRVAEMRIFAGIEHAEIAHVLGVSERTVKEDWRMARVWLSKELAGSSERGGPP
jgi:RNA polymerase sigma factor (TIGR02999 family)